MNVVHITGPDNLFFKSSEPKFMSQFTDKRTNSRITTTESSWTKEPDQ